MRARVCVIRNEAQPKMRSVTRVDDDAVGNIATKTKIDPSESTATVYPREHAIAASSNDLELIEDLLMIND